MAHSIISSTLELMVKYFEDGSIHYFDFLGKEYKLLPVLNNNDYYNNYNEYYNNNNNNNNNYYYYYMVMSHGVKNFIHEMSQLVRPLSWKNVLIYTTFCIILIIVGGITSGLNVSMLAIDPIKIKIMKKSSAEVDQRIVHTVGPLIENHHLLLVTLLVANALAMETLPIFLNQMVAPWLAVLVSVTFVLIFGEIVPQAVFSSDPLKHSYRFAYLIKIFEIILYPVCMPIAWLLDRCLKHQERRPILFRYDELKQMIAFIRSDEEFKETKKQFNEYELNYLDGVLKLRNTTVKVQRTKWSDVKTLPDSFVLDENGLKQIAETGYSRIPVYKRRENNLVGICLVKDLVAVNPAQKLTVGHFVRKTIAVFHPRTSCIEAVRGFQKSKSHFAVITKQATLVLNCIQSERDIPESVQFLGAITLEDVLELVMGGEIEDEYDEKTYLKPVHIEVGKETRDLHKINKKMYSYNHNIRNNSSTPRPQDLHPQSKSTKRPPLSSTKSVFTWDENSSVVDDLLTTLNKKSKNEKPRPICRQIIQRDRNRLHRYRQLHQYRRQVIKHRQKLFKLLKHRTHWKSKRNLPQHSIKTQSEGQNPLPYSHTFNIKKAMTLSSVNTDPSSSLNDQIAGNDSLKGKFSPRYKQITSLLNKKRKHPITSYDPLLSPRLAKPKFYGSLSLPNVMVNVETDDESSSTVQN